MDHFDVVGYNLDGEEISREEIEEDSVVPAYFSNDNEGTGVWLCGTNRIFHFPNPVPNTFIQGRPYRGLIFEDKFYACGNDGSPGNTYVKIIGSSIIYNHDSRLSGFNSERFKIRGYDGKIFMSDGTVLDSTTLAKLDDCEILLILS